MAHLDKDFRYMATSDLGEELKKDTFKLDSVSEGKIVGEKKRKKGGKNLTICAL
jgi:hypothetical protein